MMKTTLTNWWFTNICKIVDGSLWSEDVQIKQSVCQPAGINAGAYIADTCLIFENRIIHGKNHASGSR